jgi:dihydroorotase (EC 3.5.2.3)
MSNVLTITRPDDWHLHLRDGATMQDVLPHTARQFARAIVMPNLKPPVTTTAQAGAYRDRILAALPAGMSFEPLMVLYLTDNTPPEEIRRAKESGFVKAVKLYPAGATTNSDAGVTDLSKCYKTLEVLQEVGMPFLVHGEVTDPEIDLFDREAVFIERIMKPLRQAMPELKVVFEHITTKEAADYVLAGEGPTAATITAHHLLFNRNEIFKGGIRPHYYCLPVLKRETHRKALVAAATSGNDKFFLGTDSAPHAKGAKDTPVAAPAATPRCMRWSCMPRPSTAPVRWTSSKPSPASTVRTSTTCRAIPAPSPCSARPGPSRPSCPWAMPRWCRCRRANRSTGRWSDPFQGSAVFLRPRSARPGGAAGMSITTRERRAVCKSSMN